jgi:selenocysteine lyase/cysteine desulfurase
MLPSQRPLFSIPRDVCYLNAASMSPLPLQGVEAGKLGVSRKAQPWLLDASFAAAQFERARNAASRLINAAPDDVALISSVSYGVASAAKVCAISGGSRVLVLADDHSSPVLEWLTRASAGGFTVEAVKGEDGNWTEALLEAIERPGARPVALASISHVHWADGGAVDLGHVATKLREQGAALLVDATQSVGVLPLDVRALDPDFVVFPTYKWVLGPYGRAFLYIAERHQGGIPLEQTAYGRRDINSEKTPYFADTAYVAGARRFDMGERDYLISLEMAAIGMEMMAGWGREAVAGRLEMLTARLAEGVSEIAGARVVAAGTRAPHILCLSFARGMPDRLVSNLAAQNVYVAQRLGNLRISPHVYNDEADMDRFIEALRYVVDGRNSV